MSIELSSCIKSFINLLKSQPSIEDQIFVGEELGVLPDLSENLCFPNEGQDKLPLMAHPIQKLRSDFARRLIQALGHAGIEDSPTTLAHYFNLHSADNVVTMHGARRWLLGQSIPTQVHLNALAKMLGVSSAWLLLGQGQMVDPRPDKDSVQEHDVMDAYHMLTNPQRELVDNLIRMLSRRPSRSF